MKSAKYLGMSFLKMSFDLINILLMRALKLLAAVSYFCPILKRTYKLRT